MSGIGYFVFVVFSVAAVAARSASYQEFGGGGASLHWVDGAVVRRGLLVTQSFPSPPPSFYRAVWFLSVPANHTAVVYMTQYHLARGDLFVQSFRLCLNGTGLGSPLQGHATCYSTADTKDVASLSKDSATLSSPSSTSGTGRRGSSGKSSSLRVTEHTPFVLLHPRDLWLVLWVSMPSFSSAGGSTQADACLLDSDSIGFNITYEVTPGAGPPGPASDVGSLVRKDWCTVSRCSLNGRCSVSADFRQYTCVCRVDYFGKYCQYGPLCDPDSNINPCQNGATCSQKRSWAECKCVFPYHGEYCQLKMSKMLSPKECSLRQSGLRCQHGCSSEVRSQVTGRSRDLSRGRRLDCVCHSEHVLMPDQGTCRPNGMRQFSIELVIDNEDVIINSGNVAHQLGFNESRFIQSSAIRLVEQKADDRGVALLRLSLSALSTDAPAIYTWFSSAVGVGRTGNVRLLRRHFRFTSQPTLSIMGLTMRHEGRMALLGRPVQFSCRIRGSVTATVVWYRDGSLLNVTRAAQLRYPGDQTVRIGSFHVSDSEQYIHHLTIDRLVAEDQGLFSCVATDGGTSVRHSVQLLIPQLRLKPTVHPPVVYAQQMSEVVLECLLEGSPDENVRFVWSKLSGLTAARPLTSSDPEQVIHYCWGRSQLIIPQPQNALYQCDVSLGALTASSTGEVRVLQPDSVTCPRLTDHGVTWSMTPAESDDLQPCPVNATSGRQTRQSSQMAGRYVRRRCERVSIAKALWKQPNWSGCPDEQMSLLQAQISELMAGYSSITVSSATDRLATLLSHSEDVNQSTPLSSIEAVVGMARQLTKFLLLFSSDEEITEIASSQLDIVGLLLVRGDESLLDQTKSLLISDLLELLLRRTRSASRTEQHRDMFVELRRLHYNGSPAIVQFPENRKNAPPWMRSVMELSVSSDSDWQPYEEQVSQLALAIAVIPHSRLIYPHSYRSGTGPSGLGLSENSFSLNSHVVAVGLSKLPRLESPAPHSVSLRIGLKPFYQLSPAGQLQLHSCARLLTDAGSWQLDACAVTPGDGDVISCNCRQPGVYALALITRPSTFLSTTLPTLHISVIVGCLLALVPLMYVVVALASHLLRHSCRDVTGLLKLQTSISFTAVLLLVIVSARDSMPQSHLAATVSVLQYLVLSSVSAQMAIKVHVFRQQQRLYRQKTEPNYFKYMTIFIAIGVPLFITAATVTTQHTHGWSRLNSWWLRHGSGYYYGVLIPIGVILFLDSALLLFVRALLTQTVHHAHLKQQKLIRIRLGLMSRSLLVEASIVMFIIASVVYVNLATLPYRLIFAAVCCLTSGVIFGCYAVLPEGGYLLLCCRERLQRKSQLKNADVALTDPPTLPAHACLSTKLNSQQRPPLPHCQCVAGTPPPLPCPSDHFIETMAASSSDDSAGSTASTVVQRHSAEPDQLKLTAVPKNGASVAVTDSTGHTALIGNETRSARRLTSGRMERDGHHLPGKPRLHLNGNESSV